MKPKDIAISLCLMLLGGYLKADESPQKPSTINATSEAEQIKKIEAKLAGQEMSGVLWTLIHCADESHVKSALDAIGISRQDGKEFSFSATVRDAGGLAKYRQRVLGLLGNDNEIVRGFGAAWLSEVGDEGCYKALAQLLHNKTLPVQEKVFVGYDRAQAAAALGVLGARQYAPDLATLLDDSNDSIRAGAASGLASLQLVQYSDAIARLLDSDGDRSCMAAIHALARLRATKFAPQIAKQLQSLRDPSISDCAIYALVALEAKDQVADIGKLLTDEYQSGNAAIALALLGATQYKTAIASILHNGSDLRRRDAALALAILDAKEKIPEIAVLLNAPEAYVREAAAWSLVLLESRQHAPQAVTILTAHETPRFPWPEDCQRLVADKFDALRERAMKSLQRLQKDAAQGTTSH